MLLEATQSLTTSLFTRGWPASTLVPEGSHSHPAFPISHFLSNPASGKKRLKNTNGAEETSPELSASHPVPLLPLHWNKQGSFSTPSIP